MPKRSFYDALLRLNLKPTISFHPNKASWECFYLGIKEVVLSWPSSEISKDIIL